MRTLKRAFTVCLTVLALSLTLPVHADVQKGDKAHLRADRSLHEGEFATAEKLYRELIAKDPQDLAARLGLSYAQLKQRNLRDAYDNAARVVAVDPTSPRAHALLGTVLLAAGDFLVSIEEFRTALAFKDDEALAIAGLSMINFYDNRPGVALIGLRRAINLDPNNPDFLFDFAQAAARTEHYHEAADAYENFLRIAPKTDADRRARIRGLIDFLRFLGSQHPLYQDSGPDHVVVPFELENSRPIIHVRINGGRETLRFVVDTGSGMCVLSETAAQRLGIHPVAHGGLARAIGGGGRFEIVYGFITSLQMGEARIENVPVYIRQFHNAQEPVDGYLGLSVLSKYLASLDYGTREMKLSSDDTQAEAQQHPPADPSILAPKSTAIELSIRSTSSGFWSGTVQVEGVTKPQNFIVDTGASISVISEQLAMREEMSRFAQKSHLKVYGAAGVSDDVQMLMLPHVTLGSYTHPNLSAAVLDMEPINETSGFEQSGIIGGNILRFFRVTFDFQRGIIKLELLSHPADASDKATVAQKAAPNLP